MGGKGGVLFGSDYPLITPGFKPEVMPGILKGNAVRLLGLDKAQATSAPAA